MHRKMSFLWFVLGLGSRLQVVASLSITEALVLLLAPFVFVKNYSDLKRDRILPFFYLSLAVIVGCIISSVANHTPKAFVLRGLAVTCIISCSIICSHWMLRRDPAGFKWFVLAIPISAILSTFVFKASVEVSALGESTEEIMSGPLFWISRIRPLVMAPIQGWYLNVPIWVSAIAPAVFSIFAMVVTISGRSAAIGALGFAVLVLIGCKRRRSMARISRYFWAFCVVGFVLSLGMFGVYKVSATRGWLGEDARKKYEDQTLGGHGGIVQLFLAGRGDSFVGFLACRDRPIVGWGPWASDEGGYIQEFITKYGTDEDLANFIGIEQWNLRNGRSARLLPCHSCIAEFWAWYGISGLLFWIYVLFVILRYLRQDVAAVPQWYAWIACSVPSILWAILFSGMVDRVGMIMFVVACLVARAVHKGTYKLPESMINEIIKVEHQ